MKEFKERFCVGFPIGLFVGVVEGIILAILLLMPGIYHPFNVSKEDYSHIYTYDFPYEYYLHDDKTGKNYFIIKTDDPDIDNIPNVVVANSYDGGNDLVIQDHELLKVEDGYYYYKFPFNIDNYTSQYYGAYIDY